ncbi:hypothetical protein B0T13DRAFT_116463 [Neurospora crassa]|nr:hypothetical protein B0T13DRAFT_116463 [Neurospora crassa]
MGLLGASWSVPPAPTNSPFMDARDYTGCLKGSLPCLRRGTRGLTGGWSSVQLHVYVSLHFPALTVYRSAIHVVLLHKVPESSFVVIVTSHRDTPDDGSPGSDLLRGLRCSTPVPQTVTGYTRSTVLYRDNECIESSQQFDLWTAAIQTPTTQPFPFSFIIRLAIPHQHRFMAMMRSDGPEPGKDVLANTRDAGWCMVTTIAYHRRIIRSKQWRNWHRPSSE